MGPTLWEISYLQRKDATIPASEIIRGTMKVGDIQESPGKKVKVVMRRDEEYVGWIQRYIKTTFLCAEE